MWVSLPCYVALDKQVPLGGQVPICDPRGGGNAFQGSSRTDIQGTAHVPQAGVGCSPKHRWGSHRKRHRMTMAVVRVTRDVL